MGMEPMGSMMSIQAQNYQPPKPPQESVSTSDRETSVAAAQEVPVVDAQTSVVAQAGERGDDGGNGGQQNAYGDPNKTAASEEIKKAIDKINKNINHSNEEAVFGIHEKTNRVTIKIVDKQTKDVIKELPPEKTLDMIAKVWEIAGLIVDEKR